MARRKQAAQAAKKAAAKKPLRKAAQAPPKNRHRKSRAAKPAPRAPAPRHTARRQRAAPAPQRSRVPYDGSGAQPRQFPAADAADGAGARGRGVSRPHRHHSWRAALHLCQFYARSRRLASALAAHGIRKGDTVAAMLANTPAMLEAHHGVPMLGAVLNALNTRLDAAAIAFMLEHGGGEDPDHRPRILRHRQGGAGAAEEEAAGDRL